MSVLDDSQSDHLPIAVDLTLPSACSVPIA
jgi:hypothetical protein